jgi:hypothetical protein
MALAKEVKPDLTNPSNKRANKSFYRQGMPLAIFRFISALLLRWTERADSAAATRH